MKLHIEGKAHVLGLLLPAAALLAIGCSSESSPRAGSGGSVTGGGATGGSSSGSGGAMTSGGSVGTGGVSAAGGSVATGGRGIAMGGSNGTGGVMATGGTGPSTGTGGQTTSTGGMLSRGGTSAVGGSPSSGGTSSAGGTMAMGGSTAGTGGIASTGGNRDAGLGAEVGAPDGPGPDTISVGDVDPAKKITVWLAGDSTMQPCSSACPCGWGSQFQPYLNANATVVNSGAGGRSIQTWLYDPNVTTTMANGECVVDPKTYSTRWQAMLDGMKAGDYLLVEFGINDGDSTCNRHVGTTLFQSYLETMAAAAKTRGAQAIFLTSTSAIACSGSTAEANRGFGPETKAAGKAASVPVIDLTVLSAALYTSLGLCPNASDYTSTTSVVGKFFCDDHTHFETAGATQIAGVVAKALRDQGVGLAAYLK